MQFTYIETTWSQHSLAQDILSPDCRRKKTRTLRLAQQGCFNLDLDLSIIIMHFLCSESRTRLENMDELCHLDLELDLDLAQIRIWWGSNSNILLDLDCAFKFSVHFIFLDSLLLPLKKDPPSSLWLYLIIKVDLFKINQRSSGLNSFVNYIILPISFTDVVASVQDKIIL